MQIRRERQIGVGGEVEKEVQGTEEEKIVLKSHLEKRRIKGEIRGVGKLEKTYGERRILINSLEGGKGSLPKENSGKETLFFHIT